MTINKMNNIWLAKNIEANFSVFVLANDENEAFVIANEYFNDSGMSGEISISTIDSDTQSDCDYIITGHDKMKTNNIALSDLNDNSKAEFVGQIIDIFEDFLDEKGIILDNPERDEDEDLDPEEAANIFGSDYGIIQTRLEDMLDNWNTVNKERQPIPEEYEYNKFGFVRTSATRYRCPNCNNILNAGPCYTPKVCDQCGQLITFANIKWQPDKFIGYADISDIKPPKED